MTLIAVTQRTEYASGYQETRDSLDQRWYELLDRCDITPVLVPNHTSTVQKMINEFPLQGILFTGGNHSPKRFETELVLIEFAVKNKLPIFGVCHGMQVIQKYFDIKLYEVSGHVMEKQEIYIHGKLNQVNSYHEMGTIASTHELLVWAKAHDGIIKAIHHQSLPIIGIMWHPERYSQCKNEDISLIRNLFLNKKIDTACYSTGHEIMENE